MPLPDPLAAPSLLSWACLGLAVPVLGALAIIDLRRWILPDPLVAAFAVMGIVFHAAGGFALVSPFHAVTGALAGGGSLALIRMAGNRWYGEDSLGLGDVKLMAAAGLWLGPPGVMAAMSLGALAGLLHGLAVAAARARKTDASFTLARLRIPAGPGFIAGILLAGILIWGGAI